MATGCWLYTLAGQPEGNPDYKYTFRKPCQFFVKAILSLLIRNWNWTIMECIVIHTSFCLSNIYILCVLFGSPLCPVQNAPLSSIQTKTLLKTFTRKLMFHVVCILHAVDCHSRIYSFGCTLPTNSSVTTQPETVFHVVRCHVTHYSRTVPF